MIEPGTKCLFSPTRHPDEFSHLPNPVEVTVGDLLDEQDANEITLAYWVTLIEQTCWPTMGWVAKRTKFVVFEDELTPVEA